MKLAYLGTPWMAVPPLEALIRAGHHIDIVITQPDRRRGRGGATTPSPVKARALEAGLEVSDRVDDVLGRDLDLGVVVAFGRILRPHVLAEVPMVNLHFSLLPRWRGAAPVERAVLAGDPVTGVCLMEVAEGLDEGGVYARNELPIAPLETVDELRSRLVEAGTDLLIDALAAGLGRAAPQDGEVTYAAKIRPEELHLDWSESTTACLGRIRLGRAWTTWRGRRMLVHAAVPEPATAGTGTAGPGTLEDVRVATGDGWLRLDVVQPEGKPRQDAAAWWRGARPMPGEGFV